MRKFIETEILIDASASKIWSILMDFPQYPNWNSFIRSIQGEAIVAQTLTVQIQQDKNKLMTFRPKIITVVEAEHFSWQGKLLVRGVFDGLHQFELIPINQQRTLLKHNELFTGLIIALLPKSFDQNIKIGFEQMNAELKRVAEERHIKP